MVDVFNLCLSVQCSVVHVLYVCCMYVRSVSVCFAPPFA